MTTLETTSRHFKVGTTGWTIDDLSDPAVDRCWNGGRYELVEGVLTETPPAYYDGNLALARLRRIVERYLDAQGIAAIFTGENDVVLKRNRVVRPDLVLMTPDDERRQVEENARHGRTNLKYGRILVPPTLVVESVSMGHEDHDRATKLGWYAEARFPKYWILNGYRRSLECFVLDVDRYRIDASGTGSDQLQLTAFPGLLLPLAELWG